MSDSRVSALPAQWRAAADDWDRMHAEHDEMRKALEMLRTLASELERAIAEDSA